MKNKYIILLLILVNFSCQYEFDEVEKEVISKTPTTEISKFELTDQEDSIFIEKSTILEFTTEGNYKHIEINATLGGEKLLEARQEFENISKNKTKSSLTVDPPHNFTGCRQLIIEAYTNTGTGSYIDQLGFEELIWTRKYTLCFDNSPPDKINFSKLRVENGALKIEWNKYERHFFEKYNINISIQYDGYEQCNETLEIKDRDITSYELQDFVGGECVLTGSIRSPITSNYTEVTEYYDSRYQLEIIESSLDGDELTLIWNKSPFYKYFKGYELTENDNTIFESTNINDTSSVTKIRLGQEHAFKVGQNECERKELFYYRSGEDFSEFDELFYPSVNEVLYLKSNNDFYSVHNDKYLDIYHLAVSQNGMNIIGYGDNKTFHIYNPNNDIIIDQHEIESVVFGCRGGLTISDNDHAAYIAGSTNHAILNIKTGEINYGSGLEGQLEYIKISPQGDMIITKSSSGCFIEDIIDNRPINTREFVAREFEFNQDGSTIFVLSGNEFKEIDKTSLSIVYSLNLSHSVKNLTYDLNRNTLGWVTSQDTFEVYNIETKEIIKTINLFEGSYDSEYKFYMNAGRIYCSKGFYADI
ncbi:hypothetical protein [Fulvivirga lutea]|uniref:WD40 repeat domain-containing protein n=1 Tax=Fulvivirga lutea TaxID=2810512 RepID=A0A974WFC4_9BACT|nr:hypothetical protein [Fulvivirga lutea]QSE97423.1 hypothetical protein JR347_17870 [Fulvivirga lutea]